MGLRAVPACVVVALALVASGCAGKEEAARGIPESAKLAPRDAIAFLSIVSDDSSEQWRRADRLLDLFPGARDTIVTEFERELQADGLTWKEDVAPALGPELVVVATADRHVVALTQPDDPQALEALLRAADEPSVSASVGGWTAVGAKQADIDAYRTSLARGTLDGVASFEEALSSLPEDALAVGWVDLEAVTKELANAFGSAVSTTDMGVEDLAAAVSAEEDGLLVSVGVRLPEDTGGTTYAPKLPDRVPADVVAALSFGGTQGALDRVERTVDLEGISGALDDAIGISFDGVLEALSGEGVLYARASGAEIPEVTLVLDPPNADKTWKTIEDAARKVASDGGGRIETSTQAGRPVSRLVLEQVRIVYARLDDETLLVSTGPRAVDDFLGDGPKLTGDAAFEEAAERVELGERTSGFAFVDLDGLISFVDDLGGPDALPSEGREILESLDSFILQTSSDDGRVRLQGFVRTSR